MVDRIKINPLNDDQLDEAFLSWYKEDNESFIADELVLVKEKEAKDYYEAGNAIYDMYVEAGDYVIENNLLDEIGIPFNLQDLVKSSWENDVHWHIYGRFDFSGGIDGKDIKLIEFNADTPTTLYESSVLQWMLLKANDLDENKQFNNIYEALKENFKRLMVLDGDIEDFDKKYDGYKILFSSYEGIEEEEVTTKFLETCAREAGYETGFSFLNQVGFDEEKGIFDENEENFEFWFKLFPWEDLAVEEGDLALILKSIVDNRKAILLNPAYTLMFQSKGMLKILYDLFPDSPYLLETSFKPLKNKKQIEKKIFGREGENCHIFDDNGKTIVKKEGNYEHHKSIYQEFVDYPQDENGLYYQAGVFFAYESCGLSYRRGDIILDDDSKFIGHMIKDSK
jgi:glutathionylspermidine synthase